MTKRLTPEQLTQIRERVDNLIGGHWVAKQHYGIYGVYAMFGDAAYDVAIFERGIPGLTDIQPINADIQDYANFIAHAREDIPKLLAEIERLKEDIRTYKSTTRNLDALAESLRLEIGDANTPQIVADDIIDLISELERKVGEIT